ncbi:MAG: BlaI/MecI/CopY family transcriptional regulator [Myxococcales bacterium]|nr:BlaI/MecI/CopY family transcriptional regulator [Myxococcales bacterium]
MGRRKGKVDPLSRRERQIMDIVYRRGRASVGEVLEDIPDPPSYSAVRALLRVLEDKGHLRHEREGPRYVYLPTVDPRRARGSALRHLVNTFFGGSATETVAALLDVKGDELSREDLDELGALIERAREEGR